MEEADKDIIDLGAVHSNSLSALPGLATHALFYSTYSPLPALENAVQVLESFDTVLHQKVYNMTVPSQTKSSFLPNTHINCCDFPIHELVLCGCTLQSFSRQLRWVPCVVDIDQHLHRYHDLQGLYHAVNRFEMLDDVVPGVNWSRR